MVFPFDRFIQIAYIQVCMFKCYECFDISSLGYTNNMMEKINTDEQMKSNENMNSGKIL